MEQIMFDSSYLLRTATFLEELSHKFEFFKGSLYLFHHSNCSNPSLEVAYLFSFAERMAVIHSLKCMVFIFWQENMQSSIFWVILSVVGSSYEFFQRYYNYFYRILVAIYSSNGTVHIKFPIIQFFQRIFFRCISENQSLWN